MWLSAAKRRMPSRNRLPICSNTAGEAIGMPRCWCRKNTTPPGVCNFWTNADRYSRSRHEMSNAVCPSSTSLIVTTRSPMTAHLHPDHPHRDGPEDATAARKRPAQPAAGRSEAEPLWVLAHEELGVEVAAELREYDWARTGLWSNDTVVAVVGDHAASHHHPAACHLGRPAPRPGQTPPRRARPHRRLPRRRALPRPLACPLPRAAGPPLGPGPDPAAPAVPQAPLRPGLPEPV